MLAVYMIKAGARVGQDRQMAKTDRCTGQLTVTD